MVLRACCACGPLDADSPGECKRERRVHMLCARVVTLAMAPKRKVAAAAADAAAPAAKAAKLSTPAAASGSASVVIEACKS